MRSKTQKVKYGSKLLSTYFHFLIFQSKKGITDHRSTPGPTHLQNPAGTDAGCPIKSCRILRNLVQSDERILQDLRKNEFFSTFFKFRTFISLKLNFSAPSVIYIWNPREKLYKNQS